MVWILVRKTLDLCELSAIICALFYQILPLRIKGVAMATVIRLTRMGRKKKPFYRVVVTDSRKRRDGGWIESIGYYNPLLKPALIKIDTERLSYWKSVGAKMSERVEKLASAK